jgi:hypothetical protein
LILYLLRRRRRRRRRVLFPGISLMKKKISEFLGSIDIIISLTSFLSEGLMR